MARRGHHAVDRTVRGQLRQLLRRARRHLTVLQDTCREISDFILDSPCAAPSRGKLEFSMSKLITNQSCLLPVVRDLC